MTDLERAVAAAESAMMDEPSAKTVAGFLKASMLLISREGKPFSLLPIGFYVEHAVKVLEMIVSEEADRRRSALEDLARLDADLIASEEEG